MTNEVLRAKLEAIIFGFKHGATYEETSNIINAELEAIEQTREGARNEQ
jgi:hypothetical protein